MNAGSSSYGVVDTAKLFSILDFYKANMNSNAAEMGGGEQQQSFAKGEAAMMVQGLWSYVDDDKISEIIKKGEDTLISFLDAIAIMIILKAMTASFTFSY